MGSVNPTPSGSLPAPTTPAPQGEKGWDLIDGLSAMGNSVGSTLTDAATFAGVDANDDGSLKAGINPLALGGFAAVTAGPTALMAMRNRVDPLTGAATSYADRFGAQAATNGIRVTPTLISAVAGPAIADGITMIAPNLVKKYRDPKEATKSITNAADKAAAEKQVNKDNQMAKIGRAVAGGAAVGLLAGVVFLLKPDLFKKFGDGVTHAIEGSTSFAVNGGKVTKLSGVLDANAIRQGMAAMNKPIASDAVINIVKTINPMAKDAVFSNRLLVAAAGGAGTLFLANKAAGETDPDQKKLWWGITGAAALATVGGTYGIGKLTQGSLAANGGTGGLLAKNQLFMKPNIEWVKKYATTIAPITAVPAGTAASQYFNIVDDFDDITNARSPFRK
jgi:hypothetical protein